VPLSRRSLRWLPNVVTAARLAALPPLAAVLARSKGPTSPAGAVLFAGIGATDLLDGFLARRLHADTAFGRVADPLADRLLLAVGLTGLIGMRRIHPAGPALLLARDVASIAGYAALRARGTPAAVDRAGKASSALAMAATALALYSDEPWIDALFWASVAAALATLANYGARATREPVASTGTI